MERERIPAGEKGRKSRPTPHLQAQRAAIPATQLGNRAFAALVAREVAAPPKPGAKAGTSKRPDGKKLWANYNPVKYNPLDGGGWKGRKPEEVWSLIGGDIGDSFGPGAETCAARLSFALGYVQPITDSKKGMIYINSSRRKPGDGRKYIVSAWFMEDYLRKHWGRPDATLRTTAKSKAYANTLGPDEVAVFAGRHHVGVIRNYDAWAYHDPYVFDDEDVLPVSVWKLT